ncbi:ABC transporter permease subunit [Streptomyces flavalbus]|uniref:Uncharacterized protein n=1 Tax=Streptomyces flavalbus TaxID=2665155 RepID=A0ABW2WGN6_9ACTN
MLAVAAAAWLVPARTRFGPHLIAVGGDPEAARLSGVRAVIPFGPPGNRHKEETCSPLSRYRGGC